MWRFTLSEQYRYDHLLGLRHEETREGSRSSRGPHRRYLLSAASRYCKWRDGGDPRRFTLTRIEADRVEVTMVRDLVHVAEPQDPS